MFWFFFFFTLFKNKNKKIKGSCPQLFLRVMLLLASQFHWENSPWRSQKDTLLKHIYRFPLILFIIRRWHPWGKLLSVLATSIEKSYHRWRHLRVCKTKKQAYFIIPGCNLPHTIPQKTYFNNSHQFCYKQKVKYHLIHKSTRYYYKISTGSLFSKWLTIT